MPRPQRPAKPEGLNAPGLSWRPRKAHWLAVWVARADLIERGYSLKSQRLWPPSNSTRTEPQPDEWSEIGSRCTLLQSEMLNWANEGPKNWDPRAVYDGTVASAIKIYETDPDSPFQNLRSARRKSALSMGRTLVRTVGKARIPELTFRDFKRWGENFKAPKVEGGKAQIARAHGLMVLMRAVTKLGAMCKLPGCKEAREALSDLDFQLPARRKVYLSLEQCNLIRTEARARGRGSLSFGQTLQSCLGVRQKDVIGEAFRLDEPGISDVLFHGRKWLYGFDWRELDADLWLEHRLSKSLQGKNAILDPEAGKVKRWNMRLYPMIMEELCIIAGISAPAGLRRAMLPEKGPMIVQEENGLPYNTTQYGYRWRQVAEAVGVPFEVQNRDSRSGFATESENMDIDIELIRKALGQSKPSTTRIYMRGDDEATAKVAVLRFGNKSQTA